MKSLGLVKNALGEFERATVKITTEQKKRIAEETEIANRHKAREELAAKVQAMMADKTGTTLKALSAFTDGLNKTVFDSTKGSGKYGEVLDNAGDKLQTLAFLFPGFGKAVVYATGSLVKLAGAAMKQQESLNKAYETLSEFGAVDVSGIKGMFDNLQNAGFVVKEMDKFGNILKTAGPNLASLGVSTAEGVKKFSETLLAVKNTGVEKELRMLGFTTESMGKTFADFQGMMGRQGLIQGKSTQEVAKRSADYAKTLDELSKLTGQTRDELQKNMEAAANDMRVRSKIRQLEQAGDEKSIKIADEMRKATAMSAEFQEDTASGIKEMMASGGKVLTDAGARLMLATGNKAEEIFRKFNEGSIDGTEAMRQVSVAMKDQYDKHKDLGVILGDNMSELGLYTKSLDAANKMSEKTPEAVEKLRRETELQAKGTLDNQRAAEVQRQITERNMEQAKDRLTNMMGTILVPAFERLQKIVNAVGKGLAEFTKFITFGKVDFTDLFRSADDIKEDLQTTSKQLDKTNKEIEKINEAKMTAAAKEKAYLDKNKEIFALEEQLGKETNAERKKALEEEIRQKQKERATLKAEADQAASIARKGNFSLAKLEEEKGKLEKKKVEQETQLKQAGVTAEEKESPEVKRIRNEQEKILLERNKLNEIINDKTKVMHDQVLKDLNLTEEDLKDKDKRKQFEEKYGEARQKYLDRRAEIDKRLEQTEVEIAKANKQELDATTRKIGTAGGTMGAAKPVGPMPDQQKFIDKMSKAGITDTRAQANILAQVKAESGGVAKSESLKYSPEKLLETFPKYFKSLEDAKDVLAQGEEAVGNRIYGGRMGNTAEEGYKYRGRGLIQLTGKANYEKYGKLLGIDLVKDPDLANDPEIAQQIAIEYFKDKGKGKDLSDIQQVGKAVGYVDVGGKETQKRAGYAESFLQQIQTAKAEPAKEGEVKTAQSGGLLSGPDSGYPVLMHGKELVIPMPDSGNLISALESVKKTALPEDAPVTPNVSSGTTNQALIDQFMTLQTDLMNMIASKLDGLDSRLAKSNDIQENILTYSAA